MFKMRLSALLKPFTHFETVATSSKHSTSYRTRSIRIPVCRNCNSELVSWTNKHSTSRASYCNVFCMIIFGIIGLGITSVFFPWAASLIILVFVFSFVYVAFKMVIRNQINSPFRYVKFRGRQTFVRPKGTGSWSRYDLWLKRLSPRI